MSKKNSSDGAGAGIFAILVVVGLLMQIPKEVWITIGVVVGVSLLVWAIYRISIAVEANRAAAVERENQEKAQRAAAAKREREERARKEKQHRIDTMGKANAAAVESALLAVKRVGASEAAKAGWLGEIDFGPDIKGITENFEKAHALRGVTSKLSELKNPVPDDRIILAEAKTTIAKLERVADERVTLIERCATEAQLIDKSLQTEREDAKVAEKRAELHAKLSGMLYGIEAAPSSTPNDSAVDAVMARVAAYREIKNQIQLAREGQQK